MEWILRIKKRYRMAVLGPMAIFLSMMFGVSSEAQAALTETQLSCFTSVPACDYELKHENNGSVFEALEKMVDLTGPSATALFCERKIDGNVVSFYENLITTLPSYIATANSVFANLLWGDIKKKFHDQYSGTGLNALLKTKVDNNIFILELTISNPATGERTEIKIKYNLNTLVAETVEAKVDGAITTELTDFPAQNLDEILDSLTGVSPSDIEGLKVVMGPIGEASGLPAPADSCIFQAAIDTISAMPGVQTICVSDGEQIDVILSAITANPLITFSIEFIWELCEPFRFNNKVDGMNHVRGTMTEPEFDVCADALCPGIDTTKDPC